jgi:bis(5'-nucleosidyl)-tetraphosphatase
MTIPQHSFGIVPIYKKENELFFLLVQHKHAQHWSFPKGRPENDETPEESATREFHEETGIKTVDVVPSPTFVEHYDFHTPEGTHIQKTVTYFLGFVDTMDVSIQEEEIRGAVWGNAKDTMNTLTHKNTKDLFIKVITHIDTTHA